MFTLIKSSFLESKLTILRNKKTPNTLFRKTMDEITLECDVLLSIGGDGTILSTFRQVANKSIPIMGVHIGGLGFLSETNQDNYIESLNFSWEDGDEEGNDRVGEHRNWNIEYDPLEYNPGNDSEIKARNDERKRTKSYIDMPNIKAFTFLNPIKITFGFTLTL